MFSYLIQAISRYFITVLHKHRQLLTYRTNIIMIILNWTFPVIIACSFLISPIGFQYESESHFCTLTSKVFHTSFTLMAVAFVIPVNTIIMLYVLILRHTTHTNRVQPSTITKKNNKRNLKVYRNILMLLGIVLIGGTPYLLCILINKFSATPWPLYSMAVLFITLASIVESITIFVTNKDVKRIVYAKINIFQVEKTQTFTIETTMKTMTTYNQLKKRQTITINA
ncbi:unnamed protein product [Adineta steineri]|uniref:G-protein coupled receptors family 1 profile domain-containing protein n=1 Tax=Adineta steineri TaxID=433720 RepID=A0A818MAE9_9BILA|nr:unnamed protein product [Adineta steineri]CAF1303057.1 unnamed protein product [Adineta steineri]CAF3587648.1 unnamed protein product [Adineta steineri]CAF3787319.1 unnamed protein product [Adineta steineri]